MEEINHELNTTIITNVISHENFVVSWEIEDSQVVDEFWLDQITYYRYSTLEY